MAQTYRTDGIEGKVVPLYRAPKLADEEREALEFFADIHADDEPPHEYADKLRSLLERTK